MQVARNKESSSGVVAQKQALYWLKYDKSVAGFPIEEMKYFNFPSSGND